MGIPALSLWDWLWRWWLYDFWDDEVDSDVQETLAESILRTGMPL